MDVSRIMRDLSVDQLVQLQTSLEREIETKKEELRQMVGRRYRDVLEASNAVKRLTEISEALVDKLREIHAISSMVDSSVTALGPNNNEKRVSANSQQAVEDFVLLNAFLSQAGSTGDNVSDVFCLLLADVFYRKFASKAAFSFLPANATGNDLSIGAHAVSKLSQNIFDRLIVVKLELADRITEELGRETDWQIVAGGLASLALLKLLSVEALMDVYLMARLDYIFLNLKSSSSTSLIDIIRMLRDTTQTIEDVFGPGEAIISALRAVTSPGWCPDFVKLIIDDQLCDYEKIFDKELNKINASYASNLIVAIPIVQVQEKCASWIDQMCLVAGDRVRAMCVHFERTGQIVEFIVAINQLFKAEWSSIVLSNVKIYHSLFGDSILQRFRDLVDVELNELDKEFLQKFPTCNCNPMPLFQKRAVKFNALLASGVSQELNDLVQKMFEGMRNVLGNVNKYVSTGCEENLTQLRDSLADSVLALVDRFLSHFHIPKEAVTGDEFRAPSITKTFDSTESTLNFTAESKAEWLSAFRLFLAFVQHEPSVLCLCMNRDTKRISRCNKTLHHATEFALCNFMGHVIHECLESSRLSEMPNICTSESLWMELVEEYEHLDLEGAGRVDVPNQLSRHYFQFLYFICHQINASSVGHLFTRNVTDFISKKLGSILASNLKLCGAACVSTPLICMQLLFDCKALFLMFLSHEFIDAAQAIETKLDAVDLKLSEEPLGKNAKLFAQRTSTIFGQLQAESSLTTSSATTKEKITTNKTGDSSLSASYVALVDITPKLNDIRRLTLIPRLSKLRTDEEGRRKKSGKQRGGSNDASTAVAARKVGDATAVSGAMTAGFAEKMPSAASLSSFYDKISTGWFKN